MAHSVGCLSANINLMAIKLFYHDHSVVLSLSGPVTSSPTGKLSTLTQELVKDFSMPAWANNEMSFLAYPETVTYNKSLL